MGTALEHFWISAAMPVGIPVVPGPHGAGGGVVASSVTAVANEYDVPDEVVIRALAIAGAVGAIAYTRAQPTGEMMGCTGEMGISGCMASALICEMVGGTPEQVENAASFYLQQAIGWPCDPIIGGNGQPCFSRGFNAAIMPIVCADVALSGRSAVLPFHEVLDVAWEIGSALPEELRCTSKGGCAACPTALALKSPEKIEHLPGSDYHVGVHDDASKRFVRTECD
jgi:L-serine dehydratase